MSEARFNVVVSGTALDGFDLEQVKAEFSKLFSLAEAKTEQIFRQGNVVIKKNVAEASANKFISALERIGVAAHLLPTPLELEAEPATAAGEPTGTDPAAAEKVGEEAPPSLPVDQFNADADASGVSADAEADSGSALPFRFHGNGTEYFRIWIVNILLTIVTLGIYSAWAKVRNAQYFYGNTEVAGSRFAYHAKPLTILKGRLIAVALFVAYSALSNLFPVAGMVLALLLVVALPWIVTRSLRFNMRMSAWRNIRFGFDGRLWPATQAFILWPLAGVISFGLLMPLALYKQQQFIINNSRYGTAPFSLQPCGREFYMIFVWAFLILLAAAAVGAGLNFVLPPLAVVVMVAAYLYMFAFISVRSANLIYNNSMLRDGDFDFRCFWTDASYLKLLLINSLFTVLTLGFYYPWAKVRVATYKAEHLELNAHADLEGFVAGEEEQISALGEEMGDVFDMEVGL